MKILANKEIKNLFLSLSLVFGVTFLLAEVFLWLSYRRLSLLLLILFLFRGCYYMGTLRGTAFCSQRRIF